MQIPLQITFRGMEPSAAVETAVRERAALLEHFHERVTSCRVVIECQHKHHHQGNLFRVGIDVTVPGAEIAAGHGAPQHQAHEDIYVAVRDAFDAARRQLEDHARRQRGQTKTHAPPTHGTIVELQPDHGRIETADGRLLYFHRNSVPGADYERLTIGDEVRYVEEAGEQGPQASSVLVLGSPR